MMDKGGKNMDRKLNLKEQAEEILKIAEERLKSIKCKFRCLMT